MQSIRFVLLLQQFFYRPGTLLLHAELFVIAYSKREHSLYVLMIYLRHMELYKICFD